MTQTNIAIIGGSGLYQIEQLKNIQHHQIATPFGPTSDQILSGTLDDIPVAFLARHGRKHSLLPSEVPYRANIYALKTLGVKYLLSFSAVGSLQPQFAPLDMVIADQYIDMTRKRDSTFFGHGMIAHCSMAEPVCPALAEVLARAVHSSDASITLHTQGTYICIEGPQFSTLAESNWYRSMGGDIIGMTNMPEAKLAQEAQIAYASLGMVTDYDCWHPKEAAVTADSAIANLMKNAERAQQIALNAIRLLAEQAPAAKAHSALQQSLVTPIDQLTPQQQQVLSTLMR